MEYALRWKHLLKTPDFTQNVLIPFYRAGANWLTRFFWNPSTIDFEKIPKEGPALLISNHVSYVDGLILQAAIKRPVRFVIDGAIFNLPGVRYFMTLAGAIPILPNRESVAKALDEVSAALRAGELVCLFPEGQLTYTGSLSRFRPGIEWMLKRDPVPVYPIALSGLWGSVFSRKHRKAHFRWWPRNRGAKITAVCGDAIPPSQVSVNRLQREVLKLKYFAQG